MGGLSAVAASGLGTSGCSGTSSSTNTVVVTGITIRAETLTAGRGCGTAPSQVFKYAAVVFGEGNTPGVLDQPLVTNTYDCFADVTFVNLPTPNGNANYRLDVFLYNADAANAFPGLATISASVPGDALPQLTALQGSNPTWTTNCAATQLSQVQTLAVCQPVVGGTAGLDGGTPPTALITLDTSTFQTASGGVATCGAATDAGTDADAGDADTDASADASADAEADAEAGTDAAAPVNIDFDTVRVRPRVGVNVGTSVDLACGTQYTLTVANPETITLDVGLISNGVPVGQTACTAQAVLGLEAGTNATPNCAPVTPLP